MEKKPVSMVLNDLENDIVNLINQTQLSFCVIKPIIKEIYNEVARAADRQLEQDRIAWENREKEEKVEVVENDN